MSCEKKKVNAFIDEMSGAKTVQELNDTLHKMCEDYMVAQFALSAVSKTHIVAHEFGVLDSYPEEWMKRYVAQQYYLIDPVFHGIHQQDLFFCWHIEKFTDLTPPQKKMLKDADDFGIRLGTTLSLLPNADCQYFMTLLDANIDNANVIYGIAKAANYYLQARQKIEVGQKITTLTQKQQDILSFKKKGYPVKKIAAILGKDMSTIQLHIHRIKEKLGVSSCDQVMYACGFFDGCQKK